LREAPLVDLTGVRLVLVIRLGPSGARTLERFEVLGRPREFALPSPIVV
jgi:hypothetical protein